MAMGMGCPQKKGDYFMKLGKGIGIAVPEILIPDEKTNMRKWAVIACDQFVQNRQYWNDVERFVGSSPSTLHVMLPEIYLDSPDKEERISEAKEIMRSYIEDGVLNLLPPGFILVERYIDGVIRKGLMVNIDLEEYENEPYKTPLVRASEEVIVERIPPRIEIRNGADIEMPHIMLLMDDKDRTVIEPIWQKKEFFPKVYDFELMMGGGRVTGYFINNKEAEQEITQGAFRVASARWRFHALLRGRRQPFPGNGKSRLGAGERDARPPNNSRMARSDMRCASLSTSTTRASP